jgi:hypothetical protein
MKYRPQKKGKLCVHVKICGQTAPVYGNTAGEIIQKIEELIPKLRDEAEAENARQCIEHARRHYGGKYGVRDE